MSLLRLMDLNMQEMYREMSRWTPGGFVVERGGLVMVGAPHGTVVTNMAIVAGRTDVDTVARETERVYGRSGLPFSVHTRAHVDGELEATLSAGGFHRIAATPGMVLHADAHAAAAPAPRELVVRSVETDRDRAAYAEVMAEAYAVYGSPEASTQAFFERMESVRGPTVQAFLGWCDARAVSGAMLYLSHGIGGVGWVGTRPSAFGRAHSARRRRRASARRDDVQPPGVADGRARLRAVGLRDADALPDVHPDDLTRDAVVQRCASAAQRARRRVRRRSYTRKFSAQIC